MSAKADPARAGQPGAGTSGDPYLPENGNGGYRTLHYDIDLNYRVGPGRLDGRARITAVATQALSRFSVDLSGLRAGKVTVDGKAVRHAQRGRKLVITPQRPLADGARFTVDIRYTGSPAPVPSRWGEIGWDYLDDGVIVASQPVGAPSWFPCNDHPSDKATYRISVTTATPYQVIATGVLEAKQSAASTTTWQFRLSQPTPTYLVSVQIGRYAEYSFATVPMMHAAIPARLAGRFAHDFGRQPQMLVEFERMFGPYPFEQYGVVVVDAELDAPIEAQSVSVFGTNHLDGKRGSERLVAHELAHQWFGNSLTVAQWRHIWLNEGFANYAEWLWSEVSGGEPAEAHAHRAWQRVAAMPQDLKLSDPGVRRLFDDRVYLRGALTLHALRRRMGETAFFALVKVWTSANRHGSVTTDGFVTLAQRHTPWPLDELFTAWLHNPALPRLPH
ncbi:M1 family metallopeptidase [Actinokineospora auranticolor]|uniref:Aminopeptidase N n=1 Tax=Actinokineospora auranticolor TaxID=155976 RepID=A0A2S6GZA9_9PSEU|nr:M1 family metallopeptidase [Actinokineospora auranticolor]PPK70563.1 peptidase M1-like protein [Actinokineospora auranticolor]